MKFKIATKGFEKLLLSSYYSTGCLYGSVVACSTTMSSVRDIIVVNVGLVNKTEGMVLQLCFVHTPFLLCACIIWTELPPCRYEYHTYSRMNESMGTPNKYNSSTEYGRFSLRPRLLVVLCIIALRGYSPSIDTRISLAPGISLVFQALLNKSRTLYDCCCTAVHPGGKTTCYPKLQTHVELLAIDHLAIILHLSTLSKTLNLCHHTSAARAVSGPRVIVSEWCFTDSTMRFTGFP